MFDALYIGATGMRAQQTQIDTIAHNVANVNTTGFRRSSVSFAEVSAARAALAPTPLSEAVADALGPRGAGAYARVALSVMNGELKQTGSAFDLAIEGTGFIEVMRADGVPAYTRAGTLRVNDDGALALADGAPLAQRVDLPPDTSAVEIKEDGRVLVRVNGLEEQIEAGHIELVSFTNPGGLEPIGENLYAATADSGEARSGTPGENGLGLLRQGFLESSNVQMIDELVTLMLAQRAFEMNGRIVQAADQMLAITNSLYRSS
jgi:flagellar basal-body rod protein FlgG